MQAPIATANIPHRLINVSEFYRMAEAGILAEDERVELIEGELATMPPIGSFHASLVDCIARSLFKQVDDSICIRIQNPIYLSDISQPEPDIALVTNADYRQQHPKPEDVLLVIEVSDSSESYDRNTKLPLYAHYQVPEVWLLSINKKTLDIYQKPSTGGYRLNLRPETGEQVSPLLARNMQFDWATLFNGV